MCGQGCGRRAVGVATRSQPERAARDQVQLALTLVRVRVRLTLTLTLTLTFSPTISPTLPAPYLSPPRLHLALYSPSRPSLHASARELRGTTPCGLPRSLSPPLPRGL